MARIRSIKPGFFTNDEIGDLPPLARLLFIGLWTIADREGRLEDRPRAIKAQVLPYDRADVSVLLSRCVAAGFIERYEVDGKAYIQIINFRKHQFPNVKEPDSHIPAPYGHSADTVPEPSEHAGNRERYKGVVVGKGDRAAATLADESFMAELRSRFSSVDIDYEAVKWRDYVLEKPPKSNYINSLRNWLEKAKPANGTEPHDPGVSWFQDRYARVKEAT